MATGARSLIRGVAARPNDPDRGWKRLLGLAALGILAGFVATAFAALLAVSGGSAGAVSLLGDPYLRGVVLFTLEQAALSTLLSVAGAVPLSLALHRARFPGRNLVLKLFLMPQALPVLVGALAILAVWGRGGIVSDGLALGGLSRLDVYGLSGILLAHVFFNLPLATRLFVSALDGVASESWKLAGQLSLGPWSVLRFVEAPVLLRALPGAASLVFMLCVTSFTVVLVLGGGPGATTLEVAIYQSLRYDFDPARAVALALCQIALAALVVLALSRLGGKAEDAFTLGRQAIRFDRQTTTLKIASGITIVLGLGFVLAPFVAVLVRGLRADLWRLAGEAGVQQAALTSAAVALSAAVLSVSLSLALLFGAQAAGRSGASRGNAILRNAFALSGSLVLVVPPIVLGAGWFLVLRQVTDVFTAAPYMVVATNAVMAMPFVVRILGPALSDAASRHDRLAMSLGLAGLSRLRHVELPTLRAPLGLAFAFAIALSLGDLGAIALFGNQDFVTLPLLLHQRLGSYRTADAAGLALLLGALSLALMLLAERGLGQSYRQASRSAA